MLYAKVSTAKTVTFGPVLAADGTMSSGSIAYTDAKIFKNGTDGALNSSATFTHKYEGVYALALTASDLDAVGTFEVVLNKNPLSASPVKITVLAANVYDWLFGTTSDTSGTTTLLSRLSATRAGYLDQLEHIHDDTNNAASGVSTLLTRVGTPSNLGTNGASLAGNLADIDGETDAIKLKTDLITSDPATATNLATVDTVVDAIKAVTDKLDTMLEEVV